MRGVGRSADGAGNEVQVCCRNPVCGFEFGHFPRGNRRHPALTPGVHGVVNVADGRVELICPRCGTRRTLTDVVFAVMTIPKILA